MLHRIKTVRDRFKKPRPQKAAGAIVITDKTGVLTKSQPVVGDTWQPPEAKAGLAEIAMQAVDPAAGDPLDAALAAFAEGKGYRASPHQPFHSLSFDQATGMSGNVWHRGSEYLLVAKGAPEQVLERSGLTESERERADMQVRKLAAKGYRVIALAHRTLSRPITTFSNATRKEKMEFDGLLAINDTPRPEARRLIKSALSAGTAMYLVTGDQFEAAFQLGHDFGIVHTRGQVLDARRLDIMSDGELEKAIGKTRIFARAAPEHKRRIITQLKKHGPIITPSVLDELPQSAGRHPRKSV